MTAPTKICERCGGLYEKRYRESKGQWAARRFCSSQCFQPSLAERLWSRVDIGGRDECWPWQGSVTSTGHGGIKTAGAGSDSGVHRVAYEMARGPIPPGLVVHHECGDHLCCNVTHMRLMTQSEHCRLHDGGASQRERQHCKHGHPFDEANTYWRNRVRICRTCGREAMRRHRAKRARNLALTATQE